MQGTYEPQFEALAQRFHDMFGPGGGACCVYHRGHPVVDIWAGVRDIEASTPWEESTTVMAFSVSKGVVATALHMCVDRKLLDYDDRVADHWPEFARAGKADITVRQVMSHEAGLYDLMSILSSAGQLLEWDVMIGLIEGMEPAHVPGTANAYHAVTFGYIVGEIVRRTSGISIGDFVASEIAGPLGLDGAFIGTPTNQLSRVATLDTSGGFVDALSTMGSDSTGGGIFALAEAFGLEANPEITRSAFAAEALSNLPVSPEGLTKPIPSFNGTYTARSLARLYAALAAGGTLDGVTLLSPETLERATQVQNNRPDLVLILPPNWRLGYLGALTTAGAPPRAFGHVGIGGSGAWADPDSDLSIAFVTNRLAANLIADDRFMGLGGDALVGADAVPGV